MAGSEHKVPDVLAHLTGEWRTERTVRDLASGDEGAFTGTTGFTARDDGSLLQEERGTFTWRGTPRPATRSHILRPAEVLGTADVYFSDGRFFHDLDLRSGRHTADHPCAADLYRGEFEALDEERWRVCWRVRGPAKDLLLVTEYRRQA